MAARVRSAVDRSVYGPTLFPTWEFRVDKQLARLTIQAPGAPISAVWDWESASMGDDEIAFAIELLVQMYLEELRDDHGMDLSPAVA